MAVNVTGATGYVRDICATSTGRLWASVELGTGDTTIQFWYSDDNGATWTRNTSADVTAYCYGASGASAFFIDQDDHAHLVSVHNAGGGAFYLYYSRMASVGAATSWAFGAAAVCPGPVSASNPQLVVHRNVAAGSGWVAHCVYELFDTSTHMTHNTITITAGGVGTPGTQVYPGGFGTNERMLGLDFHHTQADIKAVQGGTPHLYLAYSIGGGVYFVKGTYSAGAWTWGTPRTLAASGLYSANAGSAFFDGNRFVVAAQTSATTPTVTLYERDAGDTTTTTRTMTSMTIARPRATYNSYTQDVYVVGENVAGTSVDYKGYTRATDTWGSQTVIEAEAVTNNTLAVRAGSLFVLDAVWDSTSSTRFERTSIASPPTASTWVYGESYGAEDVGATLLLWWVFHDPLPGDTQSAYALRRQIGSGTVHYWRASDSSWQTGEVQNALTDEYIYLPSGWGADADADHKYAVKTWDAAGTAGVYSAEQTITPSVPVPATLTTPTDGATIGVANLTAAWTCSEQTAWRLVLTKPGASPILWDSGYIYEPSTRAAAVEYVLRNGVSYDLYLHTLNAEGLSAIVHALAFDVVYTAPATPTLTVTANSTLGKITVAHANPTPVIPVVLVSGGHTLLTSGADTVVTAPETPTVTTVDIFVRCAGGTYPLGERTVGGDGIRVATALTPGADWIDWAAPSGRAQEYKVRAWAANGTYADSAWTA